MAFLVFECYEDGGQQFIRPNVIRPNVIRPNVRQHFSLAGHNLLYNAWQEKHSPLNDGWQVSEEDLIGLLTHNEHNLTTRRLIIDFAPCSPQRIGLVELRNVYAYTWNDGNNNPRWTPLMLRYVKVLERPLGDETRQEILNAIPLPEQDAPVYFGFLYLKGDWNWGRIGQTNAAFLYGAALEYFRRYFC